MPLDALFRKHPHLIFLGVLSALVAALFSDTLFFSSGELLSGPRTELFQQFIHWRQFAATQIAMGNLPFWNPHIFSGVPFMAGFQSALFYPPNFIFLFLPVGPAINWSIALHVLILGAFMYAWLTYHKLHPFSAMLGAVMAMFSGSFFLHVYAGHLSNLCSMVWAPLVLLSVDGVADTLSAPEMGSRNMLKWGLLGAAGIALQIFAGHPQYVYYTALTAGLYMLLKSLRSPRRLTLIACFVLTYVFGAALSAIQLLPGLLSAGEGIRAGGVSYEFAAAFSLPPENLITLMVPSFLGPIAQYWGRCFLWEMSLFMSVTGLVLAVYGCIYLDRTRATIGMVMICVLLVLAMGANTPMFKALYRFVPGFDLFRGTSKFGFFLTLFIVFLAASGYDRLIKGNVPGLKLSISIAATGLIILALGFIVNADSREGGPQSAWAGIMQAVERTNESYMPEENFKNPETIAKAGRNASLGLVLSGITLLISSGLLYSGRTHRFALHGLALLIMIEMLVFAKLNAYASPAPGNYVSAINEVLQVDKGDYRILNLTRAVAGIPVYANESMSGQWQDIWGSDPGVSRRYAEMMTYSQGGDPLKASQDLSFHIDHKFFSMFRLRYIVHQKGNNDIIFQKRPGHLPHFLLLHEFRIIEGRDESLAFMASDGFDARQMVVLENPPTIMPQPSAGQEYVRLLASSTDHYDLEASLSANGILLVTDAFSKNWRVLGENSAGRTPFTVEPVNYAMMGVILPKGNYKLRLEYTPPAFYAGLVASCVSGFVFISLLSAVCLGRNRG